MHLILDMDGTLVSDTLDPPLARPFLKLFFKVVFRIFESVSIWTAASKCWYQEVYDQILKSALEGKQFLFVYTSENCSYSKNIRQIAEGDYYTQPIKIKPLSKIWKKRNNLLTRDNTIIIDNTSITFSENYGNGVLIKTFNGESTDNELLKMIKWFYKEDISNCTNIREKKCLKTLK